MTERRSHHTGRQAFGLASRGDRPIQVMIIDDSETIRTQYRAILDAEPDIEVVAVAEDPYVARRLLDQVHPDVITLDVEMPRMDGLTFLRKLMAGRPTPVVMASTLTQKGAEISFEALRIGAIGVVGKPTPEHPWGLAEFAIDLVNEVRAAAHARLRPRGITAAPPRRLVSVGRRRSGLDVCPVLIGASTGGTQALNAVISHLPEDSPPIAIVQHMPPGFTASFADRLDRTCAPHIREARDGDPLVVGQILIAPGGVQMALRGTRTQPYVRLYDGERVNRHCPSVDVLMQSGATVLGSRAVGVLLTGMGADGAAGLKAMHDAGAFTIAQDQESCVVYGMPHAAMELGAVSRQLPLHRIAQALVTAAVERESHAAV